MRLPVVPLALVTVLLTPSVADAKGVVPTSATIEGVDIDRPISLNNSPTEPNDPLFGLFEQVGFIEATFGQEPNPMLGAAPSSDLGEEVVITWTVQEHTEQGPRDGTLRQVVYPHADGGPLVYTEPGQVFFGTERSSGGWFRAQPGLLATLETVGVPLGEPPARPPATPTRPPAEPGPVWPAVIVGTLVAALALGGARWVALARRRLRAAPT